MTELQPRAVGTSTERIDGPAKVTGTATYAYEHPLPEPVHLHPVLATVATGAVTAMDTTEAEAVDGVLAVLTPWDSPRLADTSDPELSVLQGPGVLFRGQIIGAVLATTPETARHAQSLVRVEYAQEKHDAAFRADHPEVSEADGTTDGDVDASSPRRRSSSTSGTPRPRSTTTRWSRTRPWPCGSPRCRS